MSDRSAPPLDLGAVLADPKVRTIVCCGAGGVGKTTTAAALGVRAAQQGRRAVVLTIDPARRLAQALGVGALDNTPRRVPDLGATATGSLDAMMLDMKRTFDEIILAHADAARAEAILSNPFYQSLSSSLAGTQEYMAMEKLGQLRRQADREGTWDLIVVDTPPSRSALDFLDAPHRLGAFLDGRLMRLLVAPARTGGRAYARMLGAGLSVASGVLTRVLGSGLLADLQKFVTALDTVFGGFRERAEQTARLLGSPGTLFLVVATPQPDALREAAFFTERLTEQAMPLAGLVLSRMHTTGVMELSPERALAGAEELEEAGEHPLGAAVLRLHAGRMLMIEREQHLAQRFTAAHPRTPVVTVSARPEDVHDVDGLTDLGIELTRPPGTPPGALRPARAVTRPRHAGPGAQGSHRSRPPG